MTRETAYTLAVQNTVLDLIAQGITTNEAIIKAMESEDVKNTIKTYADILMQEF